MAGKTILDLSAAATFSASDNLLTRLDGETADRRLPGSVLKTYLDSLYQPLDAELTAIAGLTSAADKLPYFDGSESAALADFTAFGRSLVDDINAGAALTTLGVTAFAQTILDDANASTVRTTLGLVIGTNVQAYDAGLTSLAGLADGANRLIYTTATDTYATSSITAFARTILDDASAGDVRTTLGLGDVAVLSEITESDLSAAVQTKLNNTAPSKFDATAAPDADDDDSNTGGNGTFAVGSVWIDVTNDEAYRCVDASTGAAVWINTTLTSDELGTIATQNANSVNITGGLITGITDIAIADGGTGASNASDARSNLGLGSLATQNSINNGDWSGTDLSVANGGTGVSTLTGLVKGNGTSAFSAAVAGTDYYAPGGADIPITDGGTGSSTAAGAFSNIKQAATTSATGVVEKATAAEVLAETADKFPDAATMGAHPGIAKVLADVDMTGTMTLDNSYNVTSITDNGAGDVTITFDTDFANTDYYPVAMTSSQSAGNDEGNVALRDSSARSVGSVRLTVTDINNAADQFDYDPLIIVIFGEQ